MPVNLSLILLFNLNTDAVNTFAITSSDIISISSDKSIIIFDKKLTIIQKIENAHNGTIFDVSLKDETNFATCSEDKSIKTWKKSENINYQLNKSILNIHENDIHKILFLEDDTIISGSKDGKIKILNLRNGIYQCNIILDNQAPIYSLLYFKEENLLISTGTKYTIFWNLSNLLNTMITKINARCFGKNAFQKLDEERIVVGGGQKIQIISVKEKKIIKEIESEFLVWAICVISAKKLFICGGVSKDIAMFNSDNYEIVNTIKNSHDGNIRGISLINDELIITGSEDKSTKIWEISSL